MEKDTAGCRAFDRSFIVGESGQSAGRWFSPDFKEKKDFCKSKSRFPSE
jgi:hypothetical protein